MKEIKQQNIVNFVDSFLVGEAELWVSSALAMHIVSHVYLTFF